jgi:hypothetical protein
MAEFRAEGSSAKTVVTAVNDIHTRQATRPKEAVRVTGGLLVCATERPKHKRLARVSETAETTDRRSPQPVPSGSLAKNNRRDCPRIQISTVALALRC